MARSQPSQAAVSLIYNITAPIKGWASQQSLAEADPQTAVVLDNMFPEADAVRSRRGSTSQSTGIGGSVDSLLVYSSATGGRKLFGAKASAVYNCTSIGAVGAAEFSGTANGKWQQEMFSTAAGQYLVICNGADGVRTYDGAVWVNQTAAITGTAGRNAFFIQVCAHKSRLWFVDDGTTDLWYLPTVSINGAAVKFPLGAQFKLGGKIVACATWSSSQGYALDDMLCIISDQGEVLLYAGTDPASPTTWALKLRFMLAPPLSNRCFFTVGADLLILTELGLLPLSQVVEIDAAALSDKALTKRIRRAFNDAVRTSRGVFGWCMTSLPQANMGIINVPAAGSATIQQFVLNTVTGGWCRFTGWNAVSMGYLDGKIYYGDASGNVLRMEYGSSDNTVPIQLYMLPAFDSLGKAGRLKVVNLVRPIISSDVVQSSSLGVAVDYKVPQVSVINASSSGNWFTWGSSTWGGSDIWRDALVSISWDGVGNVGTMISPAFAASIDAGSAGNDFNYRVIAFDIVFEAGGVV